MTESEVYAAAGMEILERDGNTIHVLIQTPDGPVAVMAELIHLEDRLIIDRAHVDGRGLTPARIRELAQAFGEVESVVEVIIQGGGAHPGSSPTPIKVEGEAMTTLVVSGWKQGFQKVEFTKMLRAEPGYSLSHAKGITDAVLRKETVEIQVPDADAERLLRAMDHLGAECAAAVPAQ